MSIKYPKLAKGTTTTSAGQKATISFTLSAPDLDALGFNTEGISKQGAAKGQSVQRTVQTALVLGGTAYRVDVPVNFTLSAKGDSGQIGMGRH